jgi:chromosome segregation ATPase
VSDTVTPTEADARLAALEHRAALAEAELAACEEEVKALRQGRDRLLAAIAEAERRREAAEGLLPASRRAPVSWRASGPVRAAERWWLTVSRKGPR